MNLLLDTHTFVWMVTDPGKLSPALHRAISEPRNVVALSVASVWEMQIKYQLGKLDLPMPVQEFVLIQRTANTIQTLVVLEEHIWALNSLPLHHRDPFDRLLIAQAIAEGYTLASADGIFHKYPVDLFPG